mgnify:CR=1 FL=1
MQTKALAHRNVARSKTCSRKCVVLCACACLHDLLLCVCTCRRTCDTLHVERPLHKKKLWKGMLDFMTNDAFVDEPDVMKDVSTIPHSVMQAAHCDRITPC